MPVGVCQARLGQESVGMKTRNTQIHKCKEWQIAVVKGLSSKIYGVSCCDYGMCYFSETVKRGISENAILITTLNHKYFNNFADPR